MGKFGTWFTGIFDKTVYDPDMAEIAGIRASGGGRDVSDGYRKVTLYVIGDEINIWVPGTDIYEVNETMKVWLLRGDDGQEADDDISTRIINFPHGKYLTSFRRSWVSGYRIAVRPEDRL